jgi:heptosyltransferase I
MAVPTTPPLPPVALNRIGIVMMSAVGDAVHVMPIIHALKAQAPAARITWVLQPGPATLVRGHPLVDDIVLFDRSKGWRAFLDTRAELARRPFDVVLGLQVYFKAGLITGFTRAPIKLGFDKARARDANWLFTTHRIAPHVGQHVQDQYFEFLDALGVPHAAPQWGLGPWNDEERAWQRAFLAQFDRPIAPIVVGTSKPAKDWMPERWAAVCQTLWNDYGLQPVLVGGNSDRERQAVEIITRSAPMAHNALGSGLRRLAAILDGAAVALSPDTGPLHLAVALRTPVISLVGYTNPKRVGPYDFAKDLMIDAYGNPGEDYPLDMTYRENRMPRITVADVEAKLAHWRAHYAPARLAEIGPKA